MRDKKTTNMIPYAGLSKCVGISMVIQSTTSTPQFASGVTTTTTETTAPQGIHYATSKKNEEKVIVRPLALGEIAMATLIFKDSIDYSKVRVHGETYLPFQNEGTAVTPNGEIYFHQSHFKHDFSQESNWHKHWIIHEMTHVWQYQLGYPVAVRGAIRIGLSYQYDLAEDKLFKDYNMEAQGDLIADYFVLKFLNDSDSMMAGQQRYANNLPLYEKVLRDFLADPKNPENRPGGVPTPRFRNN
jgi:hypothetical protein